MATCPHCGAQIMVEKNIRVRRLTSVREIDIVSCAVCDKVIGID